MGCDIHLYVEKKTKDNWKQIKDFISSYYDPEHEYFSDKKYRNYYTPYSNRNYVLFSILADVRNGYGFAGYDTGNRIEPIDMPRGLPDDVSDSIQEESDNWGSDGHSHSYFTLQELLDFNWDIKITKRGIVSPSEYKIYKKEGHPDSWCSNIAGSNVLIVSEEVIDKYLNHELEPPIDKDIYCRIEWADNLKDYCEDFLNKVISQLKERSAAKDFSDIRIVFWFDN